MTLQQRLDALIQVLGADHKSQQTSINNLISEIGTLSSLSTTDKSNLIAAINEVYTIAQAGSGVINDSLSTSTSKTYSIDKIKSVVMADLIFCFSWTSGSISSIISGWPLTSLSLWKKYSAILWAPS